MTTFVPANFIAPLQLGYPDFRLRVLTKTYADLDFEAVSTSKSTLRGTFSGNWPEDVSTHTDNLRDILEHVEDFKSRRGFTYTVLNPTETRCLGCVYIYPSAKIGYDAALYFWVRAELQRTPFESRLFDFLRTWLEDSWPFKRVAYPGRDIPWASWLGLSDKI